MESAQLIVALTQPLQIRSLLPSPKMPVLLLQKDSSVAKNPHAAYKASNSGWLAGSPEKAFSSRGETVSISSLAIQERLSKDSQEDGREGERGTGGAQSVETSKDLRLLDQECRPGLRKSGTVGLISDAHREGAQKLAFLSPYVDVWVRTKDATAPGSRSELSHESFGAPVFKGVLERECGLDGDAKTYFPGNSRFVLNPPSLNPITHHTPPAENIPEISSDEDELQPSPESASKRSRDLPSDESNDGAQSSKDQEINNSGKLTRPKKNPRRMATEGRAAELKRLLSDNHTSTGNEATKTLREVVTAVMSGALGEGIFVVQARFTVLFPSLLHVSYLGPRLLLDSWAA
ncbi:hypothetical protein BJ322DRAFT_1023209 [Thelephora terrestris]|uniref:Uncharacterized protein n=1 Tax=Thelephora terrestris TaxID=56493 RepID=A0A9P6L3I7_9AGAM|nr:hypothetical protein BJ322DRAFT_1023209 [Thelephora terrestris]